MEEHKKIEAIMNDEFRLPEVIVQRIQTFLTAKQAAQTTVLSKSWYAAWLTRPNLDFDERDFERIQTTAFQNLGYAERHFPSRRYFYHPELDEFSKFAKKHIRRYEELKLKIESFSLCIGETVRGDDFDIGKELIVKALKLGATRLDFRNYLVGLGIEDVLPREVFGYENLVDLSLEGCKMNQNIRCPRLESLSLTRVEIEEDDVISNMLSSFPVIKNLSLSNILISNRGIKRYFRPLEYNPTNLPYLPRLTFLHLSSFEIDSSCFDDLSHKFPSLKILTINYCKVEKEIRVSSRSLERINFTEIYVKLTERLKVELNVPSIRRFSFHGSNIPSVSFKSTSTEWESHVSINDCDLSSSWFHQLNIFLTELSLSKINLSLNVSSKECFDYEVGDIQCSVKHEVENLKVNMEHLPSLNCYALFDGLFRLCRPKFVTQKWHPDSSNRSNDFLCKRLVQAMIENYSIRPGQFMYGLHDLDEVNLEIYEESVAEWRHFPLKSLLDASTSPKDEKKIRFLLKWRQ